MVAFLSGAVLTAANLNSAFNALTFRAVTGTSDTFVLADNGGAVSYSNASAITATVPPFSSVAYANGTVIQLLNLGAGVVTVTAGVGVTINGTPVTLAQNVGGRLIKTATNTWYFLPGATAPGMDLITPTSVAGSGVTLSGGQVSFTAAATISVNGCFTASYESYQIVLRITGSAGANAYMRLRASGVDAATNYVSTLINLEAGYSTSTGTTFFMHGTWRTLVATQTLNLSGPNLAAPTAFASIGLDANTVSAGSIGVGRQTDSTQFDGFTLYANTGNATGTLRVYGLRNS